MDEPLPPPEDTRRRDTSRRAFFSGLAIGGLGGALATWVALRKPAPHAELHPDRPAMSDADLDHPRFMRLAIEEAKKVPRVPFGAVIVRPASGEVVAEGHNRTAESPTFHGEIDVINRCAAQHPGIDWESLVLYTTGEPCAMCQSAIEWAGIGLVVFGSSVPFLKEQGWRQIDIRAEEVARRTLFRRTAVLGGVLEEECNALFLAVPRGPFHK